MVVRKQVKDCWGKNEGVGKMKREKFHVNIQLSTKVTKKITLPLFLFFTNGGYVRNIMK